MTNTTSDLETIVRDFVSRVQIAIAGEAANRVRSALTSAFGGTSPSSAPRREAAKAARPTENTPTRRKLQLSPAGMAARKLQGQYMGLLRGLSPADRERVKKHAKENGVASALKFGKGLK
jgi:hypothetical protein